MNKLMRKERGITLIALVVTIIVLLILAGVSMQMLAGQSGILTQAKRAREETEIGQVKDYVQQDIIEGMMANGGEDPTVKQLHDILEEYFDGVPEYPEDGNIEGTKWKNFPENFPKTLTTKKEYGKHEIEIGDIYSGTLGGTEKPTVTAEDMEGENLKEYQGSYVDIGLDAVKTAETTDDWRIFYAGEGRIFLIVADYVENTKIQETLTNTGLTQKNGMYSVYWPDPKWKNLPETPTNFIELVKHTQFTLKDGNTNAKAVSQLLNTAEWNKVVANAEKKDKIDFCIGGSTLEMWCAAWNVNMPATTEKGDNLVKLTAGGIEDNVGYYVSSESMQNKTYLYVNGTQTELTDRSVLEKKPTYSTFFPHTEIVSNCYGYWLASPSAAGTGSLVRVYCDGYVRGIYQNYDYFGVRPVVCLTSGVQLQKNEEKSKGGRIVYDLV